MPQYSAPRGTFDILPDDQPYWRQIANVAHTVTALSGYRELGIPIFEDALLFTKGIQAGTDIADKEMYIFKDRGDDLLALRPEFTAGNVRAYIEHGMHTLPQPVKIYNIGPVFRYDRPQAGRYRQLHQFNVEAFGSADPAVDFEIMSVAWDFFSQLGLKGLSFQINSIGDKETRPAYIAALRAHYQNHLDVICADCKRRLEINPLRVLDCKEEQCQPVIASAPSTLDYLSDDARKHFDTLRGYLEQVGRPCHINHRLVRGLDYYTRTVFEVWAQSLGRQFALCGGGRYDELIERLGGKPTPAVGFAAGIDRTVLAMREEELKPPALPSPQVFIAYQGDAAKTETIKLAMQLRAANVRVVMAFDSRSFKAQLKQADREGVQFALILGDQELAAQQVTVKPMGGGEQASVGLEDVVGKVVGWLGW
ncbi:MAG: histidine--tRNA ligase [Chloroflexota bacterium]